MKLRAGAAQRLHRHRRTRPRGDLVFELRGDGLQWEREDAQALMERGQAPLAFNKTKPMVEWVPGTEKRTRIDFKVLPREQDDEKGAETKTKVLKYVSDTNRVQFHRSAAFKECVSAGLGWLQDVEAGGVEGVREE